MKRIETDLIGQLEVPKDAYYGIQTLRAVENFQITGHKVSQFPIFINAFAKIKKVAALTNFELGLITEDKTKAITKACDIIISGKHHDQFITDPIQGGAGTSMNMNANEVIANIGLELMGHSKGEYSYLHPNDDVNMTQSTNDTYPSSIKIAVYDSFPKLFNSMDEIVKSLKKQGDKHENTLKLGRTQLQDALPMTMKQSFYAMANMIEDSKKRLEDNLKYITGLNMGATAIGTGANTPEKYAEIYEKNAKKLIGKEFYILENLFVGTQDASCFSQVSGSLRTFAAQLSKIANDLRLLSSGPLSGLGDITLPAVQPGSSIMPGKINPVIPEVVNQACFQVIGHDTAITLCVENGQLELNAFEPLILNNLLASIDMLSRALDTLREKCIDGIVVNIERCKESALNSPMMATFLNPLIGYKKSTELAKRALAEHKSLRQLLLELKIMDEKSIDKLFSVNNLTNPSVNKD